MYVRLRPLGERRRDVFAVSEAVRQGLKAQYTSSGLRAPVRPIATMGGGGQQSAEIQFVLNGPDIDRLQHYAQRVAAETRAVPGAVDVDISLNPGKPELEVTLDRAKAADLGVQISDASETMRLLVCGDQVTTYNEGGEQYEVHLRAQPGYRRTAGDVGSLTVPSSRLGSVSLDNIAGDEAARLGRVVSNVLNFSRLERGKLSVRPQPGNLAEAVSECVERQRPALEAMGATVALNVANDLPSVAFDRDAVAEIVQNLLDNAEKHTRGCDNREIHVNLTRSDGSVDVSVSDRGHGVAADVRRRLFRPFERGNHVDGPAGLGLGLILVLALMRGHKGTVAYRDNDGGGTMFVVRFPLG